MQAAGTSILTGMMDYGRYQKPKSQSPYLRLVLKLLRRHEWKARFPPEISPIPH